MVQINPEIALQNPTASLRPLQTGVRAFMFENGKQVDQVTVLDFIEWDVKSGMPYVKVWSHRLHEGDTLELNFSRMNIPVGWRVFKCDPITFRHHYSLDEHVFDIWHCVPEIYKSFN